MVFTCCYYTGRREREEYKPFANMFCLRGSTDVRAQTPGEYQPAVLHRRA
jgi:hypothetical protein